MANFARRWTRLVRARRTFAEAEDGVAAVEFALIAAPFFFMLFSVLEVAMVFFAGTALENATTEAARQIRTGQFQAGGGGEQQFKTLICNEAAMMLNCDNLSIDVRTYASFNGVNMATPIRDGELDDQNFGFQTGAGSQIVLVRAFYQWPVLTPQIGQGLSNLSGNRRLLTAAAAFRNEPF